MRKMSFFLLGTLFVLLFHIPAFSQVQWTVTEIARSGGVSKQSLSASLLTLSTPSNYPNIALYPDANVDQTELSIITNPSNSFDVLVGDNTDDSAYVQNEGYYYSTNEGGDYAGSDTLLTGSTNLWDPVVAYDLNGNAFFAFLKPTGNVAWGVNVKKSTDAGATWSSDDTIPTATDADKEYMTVDVNPSSKYKNDIYVAYRDMSVFPSAIKFSRSTDDGSTFSAPVTISGTSGYDIATGVCLAVGPNGELYACWIYVNGQTVPGIGFNKSTDGGATWGTPSLLSIPGFQGALPYIKSTNIRASSFPSMAVDRSGGPNNGKIYIVWGNYTSTGKTNPKNVFNIESISSTDSGSSWSSMVQVNTDNSVTDKWEPWVNVDAYGGVNVVFYSSQDDPTNNLLTQAYMARSTSGGAAGSFANYQIGSVAFTPTPINSEGYMGDYLGITSTQKYVIPCWSDNRTGIQQAYEARFQAYLLVPQEYSDMASALSAATAGQTVVVAPGTYTVSSNLAVPPGISLIVQSGATLNFDSGVALTVSPGATLTVWKGVTLSFGGGASLVAEGVLNAVGTSSDPIVFSSTGNASPGSWGSVVITGGEASNSTMKYVDMSYGTGVSVSNCSGVTIENCTFSANSSGVIFTNTQGDLLVDNTIPFFESGDAVVIQQSATVFCIGNTIYSNGGYQNTGIWFYQGGGGTLSGNDIDHFFFGVDMSEGASPYFRNYPHSYSVNNRIADNAEGLVINQDSYPDMYDGSSCGGGNSIYGNTIADIELDQETYSMKAYYNYWNGGNPSNAKLILGSGCAVEDGLFITTNYWAQTPIPSVQSKTQASPSIVSGAERSALMADTPGGIQTSPPVVTDSGTADPLFAGIKYRDEGNFSQAAGFFMSYLTKHPDDQQAYAELFNCADSETTPGLIQFFKALPNQASKEQQLLLALLYERQGDIQPAVQVDDQIIQTSPNAGLAFSAEMNKFLVALYGENNPQLASTLLDTLSGTQDTSVSRQLALARTELQTYVDPSTGKMPFAAGAIRSSSMKAQVAASQLPKTFGLSQNYPNPFNPTTTIEYQVPKDAHVTLRVYNVLGQLVSTLVDGEVSAGYHQAKFNGSRFASGVYIYRLTTPTYSKVMKMLMLK